MQEWEEIMRMVNNEGVVCNPNLIQEEKSKVQSNKACLLGDTEAHYSSRWQTSTLIQQLVPSHGVRITSFFPQRLRFKIDLDRT